MVPSRDWKYIGSLRDIEPSAFFCGGRYIWNTCLPDAVSVSFHAVSIYTVDCA
jgi:hypothetical protein